MKKKKLLIFTMVTALSLTGVISASAAKDPYASVNAHISNYKIVDVGVVRGKAYSHSSNPNMKKLNVYGEFFRDGTLIEKGTASTTDNKTGEAAWYTKEHVVGVSRNSSFELKAFSRTYYKDGTSSDQKMASKLWPS